MPFEPKTLDRKSQSLSQHIGKGVNMQHVLCQEFKAGTVPSDGGKLFVKTINNFCHVTWCHAMSKPGFKAANF